VAGDFFKNYLPGKIEDREKIITGLADAKLWLKERLALISGH